ncbi:ubiquinol oxidase subunit II [Solimonas marina]|uniref:Ubiquinol oxidase subunit 2 n=1 Tax=Solimonas marina TaxID=2714601 RepID=A0A969W9P6_9GAMM|nr:ubiquinol oxidase subunit II [Solimonas marina]NKF21496.1 ubiquinol oxidase subunit II [Solimonas marina]
MPSRLLRGLLLSPVVMLMAGCNAVLLKPSGDLAVQQRDLLIICTILMLLVVVPVIVMSLWFAWRYRSSNAKADYDPDWHHSTLIELIVWSAPLLIIIVLGALTWISTHKLDPYRPIERISADKPLPPGAKTLEVEVVALNWKWLFIYPQYGIATVNELAAPVDMPIKFMITGAESTGMNSFFVPSLAGQIYAMSGMQTLLHAVINKPGVYDGFSANYSGAGFAGMTFKFHGMSADDFTQWVNKVKASPDAMQDAEYVQLEKPSMQNKVQYFASVDPQLYHKILTLCVQPDAPACNSLKPPKAEGEEGHEGGEAAAEPAMHHEQTMAGMAAPMPDEAAQPSSSDDASASPQH